MIKTETWSESFIRRHLHDMAQKLHAKKTLTTLERIALFMDGCLAALAINHAAILADDMVFIPPVEKLDT